MEAQETFASCRHGAAAGQVQKWFGGKRTSVVRGQADVLLFSRTKVSRSLVGRSSRSRSEDSSPFRCGPGHMAPFVCHPAAEKHNLLHVRRASFAAPRRLECLRALSKQHSLCRKRTYSAAPTTRYDRRTGVLETGPATCCERLSDSLRFHPKSSAVHCRPCPQEACQGTYTKKTPVDEVKRGHEGAPPREKCDAQPRTLARRGVKTANHLNQKTFFRLLTFAALLSSLICLFLLRHKQGNPLTQALMLLAKQKESTSQQIRTLVRRYKADPTTVSAAPLLEKALFYIVTSWFWNPRVTGRKTSDRRASSGGRPGRDGQGSSIAGARSAARGSSLFETKGGGTSPVRNAVTRMTQKPAKPAADGGSGAPLGRGKRLGLVPWSLPAAAADHGTESAFPPYTEYDSAFLDSLTRDELRDLILAEGGWTYIPHIRHSLPIELPDGLAALPRAGGGRFLRREHEIDSPPVYNGPIPAHTVEQVLRDGRQLLSAEAYREAAAAVQHAVRDGHLTRAVRLHGQFLYPWKLFTDEEREALRLLADQVRWFPKWVKNHRRSQRVDKAVLDLHLPVVEPQFADKYGGPGSPSMNLSQGIRFTWLGHAAGLVNVDGLQVLLDPMFDHDLVGSYNEWLRSLMLYVNALCGSLGGRHRAPPCQYDDLPADIDVVILSHNHQDHIMENDVETLCRRLSDHFKKLIWYVPEGVSQFLRQYGCASSNIFEFSWGETRTLSCHMRSGRRICIDGVWKKHRMLVETYEITFAAGLHWSGRSPSKADHNASLWGGFAISGPRHNFYYGGDTAYWRPEFDEFQKIGQILGPFHLAALPIGAYEPNEDLKYQHVKPHETLRMFKDVRAEVAVGVHWGTLRLSAENFFDPMLDLECALLSLAEEDCRKTSTVRHRYKATEAYLRYYRSARQLKQPGNSPVQGPLVPSSPATRKERERGGQATPQQLGGGDANSPNTRKRKFNEKGSGNGAAFPDRTGEERAGLPGDNNGSAIGGAKYSNGRSKQGGGTALKNPQAPSSPDSGAEKEFEHVLQEIQTLMLPMADSVNNSSNFQRLLRSLKLQDAGILPKTRAWKDNLLKEGARFQTLFVGQSIQVEASENNDYIWMSRSSGLQHVVSSAPDEHYTFNPMYIAAEEGGRARFRSAEEVPPYPPALTASLLPDDADENVSAVLT